MSNEEEKIWRIARPLEKVWIEDAVHLIDWPLSVYEGEALAYLQKRDGDASSDRSEWAGERVDGVQTRVDIAQNLRAMLLGRMCSKLARGDYIAIGTLLLPDASEVFRQIPRAAFLPTQPDNLGLITPAQAFHYMASGTVHFDGRIFYEVRVSSRIALDEYEAERGRGGRPPTIADLPEIARELASKDSTFPGSNMSAAARKLREYARTVKGVLSITSATPHDRTFKRAIERAFEPDDKTKSDAKDN